MASSVFGVIIRSEMAGAPTSLRCDYLAPSAKHEAVTTAVFVFDRANVNVLHNYQRKARRFIWKRVILSSDAELQGDNYVLVVCIFTCIKDGVPVWSG